MAAAAVLSPTRELLCEAKMSEPASLRVPSTTTAKPAAKEGEEERKDTTHPTSGAGARMAASASEDKAAEATVPRMTAAEVRKWHGYKYGDGSWAMPRLVARSDEDARPGYNTCSCNEYQDSKAVLSAKVDMLIDLVKASRACVVYTGAGISTAAGIGDYASKAKKSVAGKPRTGMNRKHAEPTLSHRVLTALQKRRMVHQWIQQNHDGLAQKAGFPQSKLNEIHGSWFDSRNRVLMMDDKLRPDLLARMEEWAEKSELCVAMGTSLCGMTSDMSAEGPADRALAGAPVGGLVIVNLQQTKMDDKATLRIFAKCDDVMRLVRKKLKLKIGTETLPQSRWVK